MTENSLIPHDNPTSFKIDSSKIEFDKLIFAANQTTFKMELDFIEEGLQLNSIDLDLDKEFKQVIPYENTGTEGLFPFALNIKFLQIICKIYDNGIIKIKGSTHNRPFIVNDNCLIMPILRLD